MVVIQTDPIWNDELGLGPPSSLKITLKRRLDFCLPCPSSQISSSNSKLRTSLGLANTGLPCTSCHFSSNFHSLLMERRRLLKMSPHPKRTSRSQNVMEILAISLSVVFYQIHLKPYCCTPSCQRQAHNLKFQ